jgi:hypothetical protein
LNVVSIRETPGRYFEWEARRSSFCWVVDTLKLVVEGVAIGTGEEGSVTAETFHAPVVAHGASWLCGFLGLECFLGCLSAIFQTPSEGLKLLVSGVLDGIHMSETRTGAHEKRSDEIFNVAQISLEYHGMSISALVLQLV